MLAGEQARTVEATGRQSAVLAGLLIISIRIAYQYKLAQLRLNSRPQRDPEQPFSAAHKGQRQSLIGTCRSSRKVLDQCCIWLATKTVDAAHEVASHPSAATAQHVPILLTVLVTQAAFGRQMVVHVVVFTGLDRVNHRQSAPLQQRVSAQSPHLPLKILWTRKRKHENTQANN